jgi:hypothetical protein
VNLLRTGQLIKVELVHRLQSAPRTAANVCADKAPPRCSRTVRVGRSRTSSTARRLRGLYFHNGCSRAAPPHIKDGHLPHWTRRQGGRSQVCQ